MGGSRLACVALVLVLASTVVRSHSDAERFRAGVHLPIIRRRHPPRRVRRAAGVSAAISLGDFKDLTYSVQIQVGGTQMPVVLDTGSSDLWVLSTECRETTCAPGQVPLYAPLAFRPDGLDAQLVYGDSSTRTYAEGLIGSDLVSVAGLSLQNQHFCAINATNTSVLETGSAGIFGLGFPFNSLLWMQLSSLEGQTSVRSVVRREISEPATDDSSVHGFSNLVTRWFRKDGAEDQVGAGALVVDSMQTTAMLQASIANYGPLVPRLVAQGLLDLPVFSIALQRDAIEIGGNQGVLSIGRLPASVSVENLTWVNVRGYPPSRGGLKPLSDAPGEVYPLAWEIPLDDVLFDGVRLSRSKISSPNISLSALIDTGNSLIRGPPDVVRQIESILGGPLFACAPHSLVFQIGGKLFAVDPRDFISEARLGDPELCTANVVSTDVPLSDGLGYMYSWNLGDPFLKGVLAAFHYGSLTHPSRDPPRIGLLSTVKADAGVSLCRNKYWAETAHQGYPRIEEPAPVSLVPAKGMGAGGVPLAPEPTATERAWQTSSTNGGSEETTMGLGVWMGALAGLAAWTIWRIAG